MRYITFALYAEGETDHDFFHPLLIRAVADICLRRGTDIVEVQESFIRLPDMLPRNAPRERRIEAAIGAAVEAVGILFLHTDGNGNAAQSRERRIDPAFARVHRNHPNLGLVPIVPVKETEAWALADSEALAQSLGIRALTTKICRLERMHDPKATLYRIAKEHGERDLRGLLSMLGQRVSSY